MGGSIEGIDTTEMIEMLSQDHTTCGVALLKM
jgi:succinyl-CoA synthetase alpha subunit